MIIILNYNNNNCNNVDQKVSADWLENLYAYETIKQT